MEKKERIIELTGDDAKAFEKYDSRPLTSDEINSLDEAKALYLKYSSRNNPK